ncbi:bifunctional folylpolyglutamate synthase/dihydrofolate synthase [Deinococcus metallilatus]|uniref:tetrahydrofolate synthase n=1 Tax=Deinococcus metallilatus TaxID=1211322 RepID=A0AAJ5JYX2_9DEIO|nr:Mur ligase family protein [Deinococcus metallilatus]MBB5294587.1 dihydrofolate synthase/folylpolyglutamate synthase [Deinococcus metallilatus]QBY07629.1 bifunctional folylpolyglutamate synthase/dihydrofolate synthase [Deinococcus metallilatus]RXJ14045.1 bifunctional folylpolyglutamate synthase/dihydrofolate synthase [Deinococcus metallilatus]TLK30010.1 bifunctional folylpolyglutamate synthase/dihydrofolate synthase [Deinococcus metallilatus]GMA15801.1 bifunctional folylpolyglutamate synthas
MTAGPDYDWLYSRTRAGRERGPEGARALLDHLGSPDARFSCIRVIGTNGKGSTCAMLEAGLLASGVRTGRFTSPHLQHYEERIRVNGQDLGPARTAAFVDWARVHAPDAAFFDLTLALACRVFAEDGVKVAVMEAGVGGVSDATQALNNVQAVALTNVDLDHVATLGPTLRDIARDKARAARPGVPLLTTATGEALAVVREVAAEVQAPLFTPDSHPALFALPHPPALAGAHQQANAALAAATLRTLGYGSGVEAALSATHPARLERFEVEGKTILLDGAHNPHATRALAASVPHADVLLFGNLARKDTAATLAPLLAVAPVRVFTAPGDLATSPAELAARHGGQSVPYPQEALAHALALTPPGGTLLVAGSLYLAGTVRGLLTAP